MIDTILQFIKELSIHPIWETRLTEMNMGQIVVLFLVYLLLKKFLGSK